MFSVEHLHAETNLKRGTNMKKRFSLIMMTGLLFGLTSPAFAAEKTEPKAEAPANVAVCLMPAEAWRKE